MAWTHCFHCKKTVRTTHECGGCLSCIKVKELAGTHTCTPKVHESQLSKAPFYKYKRLEEIERSVAELEEASRQTSHRLGEMSASVERFYIRWYTMRGRVDKLEHKCDCDKLY